MINQVAKEEFESIAKQLILWLRKNTHPHTKVIVDVESAELVEGLVVHKESFDD